MKIFCEWEHNGNDSLLYSSNLVGAYTRGENKSAALDKMHREAESYLRWAGTEVPQTFDIEISREKASALDIRDADSDLLFESERKPLTQEEYDELKALALKSAADFLSLYNSIPDKDVTTIPPRRTFYGDVPRTAREMYEHTKSVNSYYFAEIDVSADNDGDIYECRKHGFEVLELRPDFLTRGVIEGSYGEEWSVRKVLRRFIWHDRIHAKAMTRMARRTFPTADIPDIFFFGTL